MSHNTLQGYALYVNKQEKQTSQNKQKQTNKTKKNLRKTKIHSSPGLERSLEDLCSASDMS